jgi:hypothetical protein
LFERAASGFTGGIRPVEETAGEGIGGFSSDPNLGSMDWTSPHGVWLMRPASVVCHNRRKSFVWAFMTPWVVAEKGVYLVDG